MELTQDEKDLGYADEAYLRSLDQRTNNMSAAYRKDPLFNEASAHKIDYSKNKGKPEKGVSIKVGIQQVKTDEQKKEEEEKPVDMVAP
jgi:hypothetical protein